MGFVEQVSKDIDEVFFDEGFFGSKHSLDNKEITVIVDEDALEEIKKNWRDELVKKPVLLYVKECDIERKPSVVSVIEYDGRPQLIREISKQDVVWKILMGRSGN